MEPTLTEEDIEESESQTTPTTPSAAADETSSAPPPERKTNFQKAVVTEVMSCNSFFAQLMDQGTAESPVLELSTQQVLLCDKGNLSYLIHCF